MALKPYSLYKRRLDSGRSVYYAKFRLEDGRLLWDRKKLQANHEDRC
jgi:hypothetical protein